MTCPHNHSKSSDPISPPRRVTSQIASDYDLYVRAEWDLFDRKYGFSHK